jgi:hypothetical protein
MKNTLAVLALLSGSVTGCAGTFSIPIEAEHMSHLTQHFHPDGQPMHGAEVISTGIRYRERYVTVDILDGWTDGIDGRHEVFTARFSAEIPLQ